MKLLTILALSFTLCHLGHSQIEPPNYDFGLDQFDEFWPMKKFSLIKKKGIVYKKEERYSLIRYEFSHSRYKFPLFIHVDTQRDLILGFHARMPQHFDHNQFHQMLIDKYGKQNSYRPIEDIAIYSWNNKITKMTYAGTCTITCFPIFLSSYKIKDDKNPNEEDYKPIIEYLGFTD